MTRRHIIGAAAIAAALIPAATMAQSAIDAYNLSQTELRGTARFMSMAGAFTALGGDLSTLNQNPAGIGIYRGSEVGFTLDINMLNTKSSAIPLGSSESKTHVDVNNVGYIGTINTGSDVMSTFSWGISYGRQKSFERSFRGGAIPLQTSLSNYLAQITTGVNVDDMKFYDGDDGHKPYNPYQDSQINWLSILGYSGGIINPLYNYDSATDTYYPNGNFEGLFRYQPVTGFDNQGNQTTLPATTGTADFFVRQRGYVDEYSIDFGGNIMNTLYWGAGLGITDIDMEQSTSYVETLTNAQVPNQEGNDIVNGNCDYQLDNWKKVTGTGINVKFGLIFKPVNELRIGFAIHSPTYYSMRTSYNADLAFGASSGFVTSQYTDDAHYDWNLKTPWRMMFGLAGVIGGRGILSVDYEYQAMNQMKTSDSYGDFDLYNDDVRAYYKPVNTLRLGGEFRVTPKFSVRAGYSYSSTGVKDDVRNDLLEVVTAGCYPGYETVNSTSNITAGIGYRSGGFYIDMAYVHTKRTSEYHCFTPFMEYDGYWEQAPKAKLTDSNNRLVFSIGYKF